MRTFEDALRSVVKYVAGAFPDWEVVLSTEGELHGRPSILVEQVGDASVDGHPNTMDLSMGITVFAYPETKQSSGQSKLEANRVLLLLADLVGRGYLSNRGVRGHWRRIPLWDFDGVGYNETSNARGDHDYLIVEPTPSLNIVSDDMNELLNTVLLEMRVSWRRGMRPLPDANSWIYSGVNVTIDPS